MHRLLLAFALALIARSLLAADPALTIYNSDFAVLRETIPLDLKQGPNDVHFSGVTAQVEPDSVILRDPTGQVPLQILEQNYRNDPVSQDLLLSLFQGQIIDFVRHEPQKPDVVIPGKVIRSSYVPGATSELSSLPDGHGVEQPLQPIIEVDGKLQFSLPGEPRFPTLRDDTQLQPTLTWKLQAGAAVKLQAELAYVTGGLNWSASYNLVAPEATDTIDLVGWITMHNDSGATFPDAKIKLMAGDVRKNPPPDALLPGAVAGLAADATARAPVVTEKSFDEFHLYTLARPTTLHDKETKQVEFVRAAGIQASRFYVYDPIMSENLWQLGRVVEGQQGYGVTSSKKVAIYREFKNSAANHLGIPLPKGRVRFYQQDTDRQLEFVGENDIEHTPKDELIRLNTGDSFDLVGERKALEFHMYEANHLADETFEIKVRNRKQTPVEIRVVEHLYRWVSWTIDKNSQPFEKTDAQTIEFRVPLQLGEEKKVTYTARYSW